MSKETVVASSQTAFGGKSVGTRPSQEQSISLPGDRLGDVDRIRRPSHCTSRACNLAPDPID
jgi:hypothetical protein